MAAILRVKQGSEWTDIPAIVGRKGDDGYSPTVTVTDITGGHRVVITDKDGLHSFDVMDGQGAVESVNGKTGAVTLDAGDIGYDDEETYDAGSVGAELGNLKTDVYNSAVMTDTQVVNNAQTTYLAGNLHNVVNIAYNVDISLDVPTYGVYTVEKVDVQAETGASVKLGLWQYSRTTFKYTLIAELGTYTALNDHVVVEFDTPVTVDSDSLQIIIASANGKKIGYRAADMFRNPYNKVRVKESVMNYDSSNPMYDVPLNGEYSKISNFNRYNGWNDSYPVSSLVGAYEITYTPTVPETITSNKLVKDATEEFIAGSVRFSQLYGKKYYAAGDSITAGSIADADGVKRTYADHIAIRNGMILYKDAISGSRMKAIYSDSFAKDRYLNCPLDADFITLWFGANDGSSNIGTIDSNDDTTFCGAYNKVLTYYITNMPTAKIGIVVTPTAGDELKTAIRNIAKKYGIKTFDFENDANIPFWHPTVGVYANDVASDIKAIRKTQWWVDNGLHPTPDGNKYISYPFEEWMKTL